MDEPRVHAAGSWQERGGGVTKNPVSHFMMAIYSVIDCVMTGRERGREGRRDREKEMAVYSATVSRERESGGGASERGREGVPHPSEFCSVYDVTDSQVSYRTGGSDSGTNCTFDK